MNKKANAYRARKIEALMRSRAQRKAQEDAKKGRQADQISVRPEQLSELKNPVKAKKYIQKAMEISVVGKNKELLLTALRNVAIATDNAKAMRLINISDGTFLSVNQILLELGFYLQFS